jgi:enoyl-CoA hydratase/carnithine racemase
MTLRIDKDESHWTITLSRPDKLNALSAELIDALDEAFEEVAAAGVPLVALRGEGRCLSAGFDMTGVEQQSEGDLLLRFVRIELLLQRIVALPCLTVAFAQGRNFGAGVDLFAACTMRVATPDATFRMPGLKFGLVLGTRRFAAIVGKENARRLLETSATFDAAEAARIGFVEDVADVAHWPDAIATASARVTALPLTARRRLHDALADGQEDTDLAALVRSAAEPGIGKRIAGYLAR